MIQRINKSHNKASSKKKGGFVYKERSPESVKKRAEQDGGTFDNVIKSGFDTFVAKQGSNCIRFLPPTWEDQDHYGLDIWVHGFIGPTRGSYLCLQKMKNKPCPICELEQELRKGGEAEEAKAVQARKKVLTWIIDRDGDEHTPVLYMMGWTVDRDISDLARNKRTGETLLIDHPDEGYDVTFTRKGQKLNTDYFGFAIDRSSSPIADKQKDQDTILEFIQENPLPDVLKYVSAEKLTQIVEGAAAEPDEDDDEEEKPKKKGRARDADDEDESEDDGEDSKPRRKGARRPAQDEDEDEESEDEKPRRQRSRTSRDESDDDEDDDDSSRKPSAKSRKSRDEDDDDEEESDDDEEATPRRRGKSRSRPSEDDAEEGDEDEESDEVDEDEEDADEEDADEEEEEEKPQRRVRSKKPAAKAKDDDDDEEEEKPRRKKPVRRAADDEDEDDED